MNATILIVDDEPNVRLVFRTALESSGYLVEEAADGAAALARLAAATGPAVALVLLDLQMPGVGGMETLRRLREAGRDVPVVIVTAHGGVPDAVGAMKLGAIDFLAKPILPDALRNVVAEVLARHVEAPHVETREVITAGSQFASNMARAKRALNNRWFPDAEVFLRQAIALSPSSAEAHNLMGVLHELRGEHGASYLAYKAALKADGRYEPAKHNMTRYYERVTFGRSEVPVDTGD